MGPIEEFYARRQARLESEQNGDLPDPYNFIDWNVAWNSDFELEWLVDGLWPLGRHLHIFASAKSGKSLLMLWIAANIACGRDPFTQASITPRMVVYVDFEMTMQDVIERLQDMGFEADQIKSLRYALHPMLKPLDTNEGGQECLAMCQSVGADVVIFDTLSRVVRGEENSNDTYRNFHLYTGMRLKAAGISMARLDHEGKVLGTSRGASAKADDVDLIYQLVPVDGGIKLKKTAARVSFTRDEMTVTRTDEPLGFAATGVKLWPSNVLDKAKELDEAGVPLDVSRRQASLMLKAAGKPTGKTTVLNSALAYRKWKLPLI